MYGTSGCVLEGEKQSVTVGWTLLNHLKQSQPDLVREVLDVTSIEEWLTLDKASLNRAEVALLVAWYLSLDSSKAVEESVRCRITDFLRENVQGDIEVLVNTCRLLCEYPGCIPVGSERIRFCEVTITSIADLPMPKAQSSQVLQLTNQMRDIEALLGRIWEEEAQKHNEDLVFRCLAVLHTALVDHPTEPCPALAAVLHLVDPDLIPRSVGAIQHHARTLRTLCEWLLCWPRARLSPWVLALMDALEADRQFDVLLDVTLATVDRLFMALLLPALRPGIVHVVWRMIGSSRHSSKVFHKLVVNIPILIKQLIRENSESSLTCLQTVINMSHAMMNAFPCSDATYDPLLQAMKDCAAFLPPGQFPPEDMPLWSYEASGTNLDYAGCLKTKERSVTGHVGLNNLGNTCYMNSVLQTLFMTYRFCCAVLESEVQSQPLLAELQGLFALLLHSRRQAISPTRLLAVATPPGFQPGHQQDSSEFLTYVLDVLHEQEKLTTASTTASETVVEGGGGDEGTGAETDAVEAAGVGAMTRWTTEEDLSNQNILQRKARSLADFTQGDDVQQLNNSHSNSTDSGIQSVCGDESGATASSPVPYESLVQQCFGGRLLISFKCLQCQAESVQTDHFRDIQLAFPPGSNPTNELYIQDLLDYFISPEQLSGDNQYRCEACGGLRDARRSVQILQFPSHLVLTLKRFQFNSRTGQRSKLLHRVHCSDTVELCQQPYKLYAAVVHSGPSMDTGHYYTLARDHGINWYIFNDSLVVPCNPPSWSPPDTPYILFYARPEEPLQPPVDLAALPPLQPHLVEVVHRDNLERLKEAQGEEEKRRKRRKQQTFHQSNTHEKDRDNEGNPPGSCGGSGMDLSHSRFVF
ncbi:hypothetical protein ANN_21744 [Periplaneta americana]|uniref:USP domain-containing protein n=1 Tax=Periplaneta americana TaxID=6978 RepID=A0ABQ8S6S8_PERAM|nr:hypothetical protein ANN_21744 [Periplaneta americana]